MADLCHGPAEFRSAAPPRDRALLYFRSRGEPLARSLAALLHRLTGIKDGHRRGLVAAQCPKLRVGQIGVGSLGVAAVAQTHELDLGVDAGGSTYRGNAVAEVILLPRQISLSPTVGLVAHHD